MGALVRIFEHIFLFFIFRGIMRRRGSVYYLVVLAGHGRIESR